MARFAAVNDHDKSAWAWIAALLSLCYSTLTLGLRAYLKNGAIGLEDAAMGVAQLLAWGEFGAAMYAITQGIGMDLSLLDRTRQMSTARVFEASQILYVLALALSKVSVILLISRIFSQLEYRHASTLCRALMGVMVGWGLASALAISVACNANQILPGYGERTCQASVQRWFGVMVTDCLTELALIALPIYFSANLQMSVGNKAKVSTAFAFRLGLIAFAILHYVTYARAINTNSEGTSISSVVIWQQISLCYSLISATVPISRNFINRFATGNVVLNDRGTYSVSDSDRRRGQGSTLDSMKGKGFNKLSSQQGGSAIRPDVVTYSTTVYHDNAPTREERMGSQDMIIWREDAVTINHQ